MKKVLILIMAAALVVVLFVSAGAEEWSFFGSAEKMTDRSDFSDTPFDTALSGNAERFGELSSGSGLTSFVPIQFNQLVVSLVDVTPDDNPFNVEETPFFSHLQFNTGIKTEAYLTDSETHLINELFGDNESSLEVTSSVIFVGVGLDFKSGYLKGNAFIGRPMETLTNRLYNASDGINNQGLNTDALGFEASAGYKLNEKIALGAGFGRMNDKNKETEQMEEIYAVYAQAILAIAPGINVIPEVGQIERIKEEAVSETRDESFYAGAIWEIHF